MLILLTYLTTSPVINWNINTELVEILLDIDDSKLDDILDIIVVEISWDDTETDGVLTMVLEDDREGSLLVVVLDVMKTIVDVEDDDITIKLY